jgi:hypothetical protein
LQINYGRFCTASTCEEVGWMYFGKQWPERRPLFAWEPCGYLQYFPCQHRPICDGEAYKGFAFRRRGRMVASEPGEWFAIRCHGSLSFNKIRVQDDAGKRSTNFYPARLLRGFPRMSWPLNSTSWAFHPFGALIYCNLWMKSFKR